MAEKEKNEDVEFDFFEEKHEEIKISLKEILKDIKNLLLLYKDVSFFVGVEIILTVILILMFLGVVPMF